MSVIESDRAFATPAAGAIGSQLFSGRTPLNVASARVASQLRHRAISPGSLSLLARLADYVTLVGLSAAIFFAYVAPSDGYGWRYLGAVAFLPAVTISLIGAFNGYTLAAFRRLLPEAGRAMLMWTGVFGAFTLLLFFLKMGEDFSRVWLAAWFLSGIA